MGCTVYCLFKPPEHVGLHTLSVLILSRHEMVIVAFQFFFTRFSTYAGGFTKL